MATSFPGLFPRLFPLVDCCLIVFFGKRVKISYVLPKPFRLALAYTHMLVVCIRMYPYVPCVTLMLLVVLVWCFSHDRLATSCNMQ